MLALRFAKNTQPLSKNIYLKNIAWKIINCEQKVICYNTNK